jgi:PQQ-dependent dehydrogenase (methanol/ethanol family)
MRRSTLNVLAISALALFLAACSPGRDGAEAHKNVAPVIPNTAIYRTSQPIPASDSADNNWIIAPKDYASTRFSRLTDITRTNVKDLKPVITFSTGVNRGHEAAPIVVNNTMYIVTPYPHIVYALDLTKPGAPAKWTYNPKTSSHSQGVACCDVVNRGCAYSDGRIHFNTLDGRSIALDAETGKELWSTQLGDINKGETLTMAPIVVKNKVLVGNSGGEFGVRGWLTALDAATGKIAWKAYSTGPDSACLIGPRFKPHYEMDQGKDLGVSTWPPNMWQIWWYCVGLDQL